MNAKINSLTLTFGDENILMNIYRIIRWSHGIQCPHCKSEEIYQRGSQGRVQRYSCNNCNKIFNDFTGTSLAKKRITLYQTLYIIIKSQYQSRKSIAEELNLKWETVNSVYQEYNAKIDPIKG
jgi:transposase-like protein